MSVVGGARTFGRSVVPAKRSFSASTRRSNERLVICGTGWAGHEVLKSIDKTRYSVTIISPNTYSVFTPLLAGAAVGTIEFRAALDPVRYRARDATFLQAWAERIDFTNKVIHVVAATPPRPGKTERDAYEVAFDKLVLAPGCYSQTFSISGVREHAYFLKDVKDARRIRNRLLELLEIASQPTLSDIERRNLLSFSIVGGGPTGIEFAAELHDFIASEGKRYYPGLAPLTSVTVYETGSSVLGAFDETLQAYAQRRFAREGIKILTGMRVKAVHQDAIEVEDRRIPSGMTVWSTGLAPNPLIEGISELKKDEKTGSLVIDDRLHPIDARTSEPVSHIWAMGDAAVLKDRLPATAQVASQQGKYAVKALNDLDEPSKPFVWQNRGSMAYIGSWTAIYDRAKNRDNKDAKNPVLQGRAAWLLWRTTYTSMSSGRNMLLVPIYWVMSWIFGRDISRF